MTIQCFCNLDKQLVVGGGVLSGNLVLRADNDEECTFFIDSFSSHRSSDPIAAERLFPTRWGGDCKGL
jgi:hypothetical protein